jgi:hypothetical protein
MRGRGLLAAIVVAAGVAATSAQATSKYRFDGTYSMNDRHTPGYLKVDCTAAGKSTHIKKSVPLPTGTIHVLHGMLDGHPLRTTAITGDVHWKQTGPLPGGSAVIAVGFTFSDIGFKPSVTETITTVGHWTVSGVNCSEFGSVGRWGHRIGP